ncbi:MAG: hypothetical protein M1423_03545, partial [Acidobacteria bacterium]|nr:hypothetical protein [Acidobacteriota bacterium]
MEKTARNTDIAIAYPDAVELELRVSMGACRIRISGGAEDGLWASGAYEDPTGALPPRIEQDGGVARIRQRHSITSFRGFTGRPQLNLALGGKKPFALRLETGACEGVVDLGGLPLTRLVLKQGAGNCAVDFSEANPAEMGVLDVDAGAVNLVMRHLANANFHEMALDGGAAAYELDFGGALQRDASVRINSGVSSVKLIVSADTAAKLTPGSVLGSLNVGDGLTKKEGAFWTAAAIAGKTPVLSVVANVALGEAR